MSASQMSARPPTPASRAPLGGGRSPAPAGRSGFVSRVAARFRQSTWFPVFGKAAAIAAGMVGLSAIGAASALSGSGVPVASAASAEAPATSVATLATSAPVPAPELPVATEAARAAPSGSTSSGAASPGVTADGKVVLNQATAEELRKLPRVGAKRAQAIVELRQRLGRFRQATDLLRVRGIGRKTLRLMLPVLVLDAPKPADAPGVAPRPAPPPAGTTAGQPAAHP